MVPFALSTPASPLPEPPSSWPSPSPFPFPPNAISPTTVAQSAHISLLDQGITPGSTIDVLARLCGGAPDDTPPGKRHKTQSVSDALVAFHTFFTVSFPAWRRRTLAQDLARDTAKLLARWSAASVDAVATQDALAAALGIPPDTLLDAIWAWEAVEGWVFDPAAQLFTQDAPMDLDTTTPSPDALELSRLRDELARVSQEGSLLRAQLSPPLSESQALQLLSAAPPHPMDPRPRGTSPRLPSLFGFHQLPARPRC